MNRFILPTWKKLKNRKRSSDSDLMQSFQPDFGWLYWTKNTFKSFSAQGCQWRWKRRSQFQNNAQWLPLVWFAGTSLHLSCILNAKILKSQKHSFEKKSNITLRIFWICKSYCFCVLFYETEPHVFEIKWQMRTIICWKTSPASKALLCQTFYHRVYQ